MINPRAQLATLETPTLAATRDGFGRALVELGKKDPRVVVLCADLADSTKVAAFKETFPSRYIELGVAEQNLATVAAGLAVYGKVPFIASYAAFNPGRNNEQIRTTIAINDVPVKIAGMHAGVSVGPDGATHQALEDIALMRVLPNMTVLYPSDAEEAYKATLAAAKAPGPVYIRLAREKTPLITSPKTPFAIGRANILWDTQMPEVAIFATGPLVYQALMAAKSLEREMQVMVVALPSIKPLDVKTIVAAAKRSGGVVTVEEHQIAGGMGSAVAETLAQHYPVPIEFVGVRDSFGQSGTPEQLLQHYGLGASHITAAARKIYHRNGKG